MKPVILSALLVLSLGWFAGHKAFSQAVLDSVGARASKLEIVDKASSFSDSLQSGLNNNLKALDTLQMRRQEKNSINKLNYQLDSVQRAFDTRADSLTFAYKNQIRKLDSLGFFLRKELDSVANIDVSENVVDEKLDSLAKLQSDLTARFEAKLKDVKDQASSKIERLNLPPELSEKARAITGKIEGLEIPRTTLGIPSPEGIRNPLGNLDRFGKLEDLTGSNLSSITSNVGNTDLPSGLDDLNDASTMVDIPNVKGLSEKLNGYVKEAGQLSNGNLNDSEYYSRMAEEKLAEASGIKEMERQTESLTKYKEMMTSPPDQDSLKAFVVTQATEMAINHFAGKEGQLQEAMTYVAKYKSKYTNVSTIKQPLKSSNQLRGRPLIERIVPGIAMQFQKEGDDLSVDFNPYVAYRVSAKINAGLGWNQRIAYNTDYNGFNPDPRIFGPRIFGEYHLRKSFSPRAELEMMNTHVPSNMMSDPPTREWVWGAFVGLKKDYRFFKNIKGTFQVMTRLFNPDHKSPYADVLNVRFGFEFPMKRKNSKNRTL